MKGLLIGFPGRFPVNADWGKEYYLTPETKPLFSGVQYGPVFFNNLRIRTCPSVCLMRTTVDNPENRFMIFHKEE